jgi:membrane protein
MSGEPSARPEPRPDPAEDPRPGLLPRAAFVPRARAAAWRAWRFLGFVAARFVDDNGLQLASGLSYVSLLALVPMLVIALAILAAFPAFDTARTELHALILSIVPPGSQAQIEPYYEGFIENAAKLTGPGIAGLAVTAVLLLNSIDEVLSRIFRESATRPVVLRVLIYWSVLTMGPLLFGASISVSSYVFALARLDMIEGGLGGTVVAASRAIAILLSTLGFALIFKLVPHRSVSFWHALVGGLTAAVLMELLKYGFGIYIANVRGYQVLYGAVAAIPLFLLWLYLVWTVVILGAEAAAAIPEWRYASARGAPLRNPGDKLALALAILEKLQRAAEQGDSHAQARLHRGLPTTPAEVDHLVARMRRAGLVDRATHGKVLLARDLNHVSLGDLLAALELDLSPSREWHGAADGGTRRLAEETARYAQTPLSQVIAEEAEADSRPKVVEAAGRGGASGA